MWYGVFNVFFFRRLRKCVTSCARAHGLSHQRFLGSLIRFLVYNVSVIACLFTASHFTKWPYAIFQVAAFHLTCRQSLFQVAIFHLTCRRSLFQVAIFHLTCHKSLFQVAEFHLTCRKSIFQVATFHLTCRK